MEISLNQPVNYHIQERQATTAFESQEKDSYTYEASGNLFTVIVPTEDYAISLSHDFQYWIDYAGPMLWDGYTEFSEPLQQGICLEATSSDQLNSLYYIFLPPPRFLPDRIKMIRPLPEQFINYIAQKNHLVFLDLPNGRTSGVYPPDYWNERVTVDYPQGIPLSGRLIHPEYGSGRWQLRYWKNVGGHCYRREKYEYTVLLSVSYDAENADTWFTTAEEMLKPKK